MTNSTKIIKTKALNKINENIVAIVVRDIEKIGGVEWKKNGLHRAYFSNNANLEAMNIMNAYAQPYNAYIDLKTGEFVCDVSEQDFNNSQQKHTERNYWEVYKYIMTSEKEI